MSKEAIDQPKFPEDLEKAITELSCCLMDGFSTTPNFRVDDIKKLIKDFLSANHLVQLAEDQTLPTSDWKLNGDDERRGWEKAQRDMTTPKGGCVWRRVKE